MSAKTWASVSRRLLALLYLVTIGTAALDKLLLPETPKWFVDQFNPTFIAHLPGGLGLSFYGIGVLEALTALVMLVAIAAPRETLRARALRAGLTLALALFIALTFGERVSHQFETAASLFFFAAFTFIFLRSEADHLT